MKNILFIAKKLANGGSERVIASLADRLKDKYNVIIVAFKNDKPDYFPDVKIIDLKTPRTTNYLKKVKYVFVRYKAIKKIKQQYNIDCSISFMTQPNLLNLLTKNKEKTIISIRNNLNKKKLRRITKMIGKLTYKKADKIITVSKEMEIDFKKEYSFVKDKVTTICNAYDSEKIENLRYEELRRSKLFKNKQVVITMGRLAKQKGQWNLIRAFTEVVKKYPNAQLLILGRGSYRKYLQKLIEELGLIENASVVGFQKNPFNFLEKSDVFILPSYFEGMSNALLEAVGCDMPVIASDCKYGNKEIICKDWTSIDKIDKMTKTDYGILIPLCDEIEYNAKHELTKEEKEIAKAIIYALENKEELRKASMIRKQDFILENRINEWINVIEN